MLSDLSICRALIARKTPIILAEGGQTLLNPCIRCDVYSQSRHSSRQQGSMRGVFSVSKRGENIYKRKDGRWEGRYIKERSADGKARYAYVYGKSYADAKQKLLDRRIAQAQNIDCSPSHTKYGDILRNYKAILEIEIVRMIGYLEKKFELDKKTKKLSSFGIETSAEKAESITFVNSIGRAKKKTSQFSDLSLQIDHIITQMSALEKMEIDDDDRIYIQGVSAELSQMKEKYNTRVQLIEAENSRMETVSKIIRKYSEKHRRSITDAQKRRSEFTENVAELKNQIIDLINVSNSIETYVPFVEYTQIRTNSNQVFDYEFISKLEIEEINTQYFLSLISRTLKAGKTINWMTITESELQDALLKYDNTPVLQFFSNALHTLIEADLRPKNSIIYQGMDKYAEMSSGLDAKIYFDLLSYEMQQDGIYIIDQPEDNISQNAIREYLLDRFKTMGENRQVIMVTHNPQFIVNLDVDNLIFLSKKNGLFSVQSGALEYVCPEYSVLDIVAQNIDGGLDSIKKRWKRYEKTTEL